MMTPSALFCRFLPLAAVCTFFAGVVALSSMFAGAAGAAELDGAWQGTYACPSPTDLTFIIKHTTPGKVQAEFVFQPKGSARRIAPGHFPMKGTYNTADQSFDLVPGVAHTMPPGYMTVKVRGRLVSRSGSANVLSLHIHTCRETELKRVPDTTAEQAYSQYASAQPTPSKPTARVPAIRPNPPARSQLIDAGFCDRAIAWLNQLEDEVPFPGPAYRGNASPVELLHPLFTDERFKSVVGKVYTDLQDKELRTIGSEVSFCLQRAKQDPSTRSKKRNGLRFIFDTTVGVVDIKKFVVSARENQTWRVATWKEIQAKDAGLQTYDGIVEFTRTLAGRDSDMWPREKEAFYKQVVEQRRESAEPALRERVEKLLKAEVTPALLADLAVQLKPGQLWEDNTPDAGRRETLRLEQKRDKVLAQLAKQEQARLKTRGKGLEALAWGLAWMPQFESSFASFKDHPSVIALQEQFQQLRKQDLSKGRRDLLALIKEGEQAGALGKEVGKYIDRRFDAGSEEGQLIFAALDQRINELSIKARELELERHYALVALNHSKRENRLMASPGRLPLTVPESYTEPDDQEIGLAIMREMTAGGGRMLSPTTVEIGAPPFDRLMPIRLDSMKVEKEKCKRMSDSHAYTCSFRHFLQLSFPEQTRQFFRRGGYNEFFEGMIEKLLKSVNNAKPGVKTHVFVLTGKGWRSPTMRQQSIEATLKFYADTISAFPQCKLVQVGNQFMCD
ncbi:hypothetical protein H0A66_02380 [Alcaligenaceae bacterium]|nr:hypothetical protein [Alcaligenaceae bacterium]